MTYLDKILIDDRLLYNYVLLNSIISITDRLSYIRGFIRSSFLKYGYKPSDLQFDVIIVSTTWNNNYVVEVLPNNDMTKYIFSLTELELIRSSKIISLYSDN